MPSGDYLRLRRLAVGGMAEVFLARRVGAANGELAILKSALVHDGDDPAAIARMFAEEARLMSLLAHRNIVRVLEVFDDGARPVIAMEYVDGESLAVLIRAAKTAGKHRVAPFVEAVAQAARGLDAAHAAKDQAGLALSLVHRDVSPQNIMVGRDGVVKVLDFGIAKAAGSSVRTQTGVLKGKAAYMAPEQVSGQALDARTDVYALGVVLWEAVVGRRPFQEKSEIELLAALAGGRLRLPPARDADPQVDPALERIITQASAPEPHARFGSARELAAALDAFLGRAGAVTPAVLGAYVDELVGVDLARRRAGIAPEPIAAAPTRRTPQGEATGPLRGATPVYPLAAEASLFEGLFRRVPMREQLREELARLGVDPKRLAPKYRVDVWARSIEIVRRHVYPDHAPDEGNRRLGYDFAVGFQSTIGGKMVLAMLPLLQPPTLLARLPRIFKLGRGDMEMSWATTSKTTGSLTIKDQAQVSPYFDIGLIQYLFERMRATAVPSVEWKSLTEFSIHYVWE